MPPIKKFKFSEEYRKKLSEAHKGYKFSEEAKRRMSEGAKHRKITPLFRKARSDNAKINPNYGMRGKHHSEETKIKISLAKKGKPSPRKGAIVSEETKEKMRQYRGDRTSNWQGGKSFEPYSIDWTKTLRRSIRERDRYTCQLCGREPAISVHHIDYNKKNCNPKNLITLCNSCNAKVNFNREYWMKLFINKTTCKT